MPTRLLSVEHYVQEEPAGCLAACAQMLLAYLGIQRSQVDLSRLFDTTSAGTPRSRLQRLDRYDVSVQLQLGDESTITRTIDMDLPLIVFVRTGQLTSYWRTDTQHALVIVGYDDESFFVNDPAFDNAPVQVLQGELILAWLEMDYAYAVITQ